MAIQKESKLSRRIMNQLRDEGVFCFKVHGSEHMMSGLPDIIACVDGLFVGLEVKLPGEADQTSARQDYIHTRIRAAQGVAEVVTSPEEALGVVNRLRASLGSQKREDRS